MEPAAAVTLLWGVFGGLHIGLSAAPIRSRLVAHLGESGFVGVFSLAATVSFAALVRYYATHRWDGVPGLALGGFGPLRWTLIGLVVVGIILIAAGLTVYPRLPSALFGQPIRAPRGVERITRHPFFAGTALFALAHALLATRLVGTAFAAGFALLAITGARHQDARLLADRGEPYADYLAATSAVPFAALITGRQRIAWRELPAGAFAGGAGLAIVLRAAHGALFAAAGAWIVAAVVGGGAIATLQSWRRARRIAAAATIHP
jgi:uncharacterized membrane protein